MSIAIGNVIRKIRIQNNMTMKDLAHEAEMEYMQLSRIELGKINTSVFQLFKIASVLKINLSDLFEMVENEITQAKNETKI